MDYVEIWEGEPLQTYRAPDSTGQDTGDDFIEYYAAKLYVPDPESRSGWTVRGVEKLKPKPPKKRALGYRREK